MGRRRSRQVAPADRNRMRTSVRVACFMAHAGSLACAQPGAATEMQGRGAHRAVASVVSFAASRANVTASHNALARMSPELFRPRLKVKPVAQIGRCSGGHARTAA